MIRMEKPRILVHEYVTGGGWPEPELPVGLADEALAMLRAVLADFRAWGQVHTMATSDARLASADLAADRVVVLRPDRQGDTLLSLAAECTAALVIAPESQGVLAGLSQDLESLGVRLLGARSDAVAVAADKWQCYQLFRENAIPTPETYRVEGDELLTVAERFGPPWVVKPQDGVGAEGVGLATDLESLGRVQALLGSGRPTLLQRYIKGVHASVSLLTTGQRSVALSLNEQRMEVGLPFVYRGGRIPLEHPLEERAMNLARQAVGLIPGLRGYVGVDLVLTPSECYVLEINPRLTTSYVGLRRVTDLNLAEAIWQSCCDGRLPERVRLTGTVSFDKDGTCD
jgi:hypothetical protein